MHVKNGLDADRSRRPTCCFRTDLDAVVDMRHSLGVRSTRMAWADIEAARSQALAHKDRRSRVVEGHDLFGHAARFVGTAVGAGGCYCKPTRRAVFPATMDCVASWVVLCAVMEPFWLKPGIVPLPM